jgi:secreted trypsin-like serine protease
MRSKLPLVSASVTALLAALLVGTQTSAHAITFGTPDAGEHPNVGSFVGEFTDPDTGDITLFQLCTGTLVDQDVVLSASHCFSGLPPAITDITFTLDETIDSDRDGDVDADVELLTGTPVTHPLFGTGGQGNPYDIAVFLLDDPVTDVEPAALAPAGTFDEAGVRDETFTAVGYGTVRTSIRKGPQGFEVGWRREKADQELLSVTKAWATLSMNPATGNAGTCYGDSGGPHFLDDVVVSITVTGDFMCKATDKTYRVDTPWAREFLSQFISLP